MSQIARYVSGDGAGTGLIKDSQVDSSIYFVGLRVKLHGVGQSSFIHGTTNCSVSCS